MNPWKIKRQIEMAHSLADQYGFDLRDYAGYGYPIGEKIYLFAKADNDVFTKEMVLNVFDDWKSVLLFFQGYEKCEIAWSIGGKKK